MSKMPHKDPSLWQLIVENWTIVSAPFIAILTAYLRAEYEGTQQSKRMRWIEGGLLGLATVGVSSLLKWLGIPPEVSIAAAVTFGFVGVETLKDKIKQKFQERI